MKLVVSECSIRIDKYLKDNTEFSRSLISKMMANGFILVNGKKVKVSYLVKENDEIEIKDGFKESMDLEPENIHLDIVYEDEYIIVVNKPSGMVVHPGNGNKNHTLVNALLFHTKNLSNDDIRPGIVHRIDKDTSGLLLIAKTNETHAILSECFKNHIIKREYIALLKGKLPYETAYIDAPIGRDRNNINKMTVTSINSKNAITTLKVIKRFENYTLVKLKLNTGRTHQIRVHLSHIGYPIYNDPVYTKDEVTSFGQFLHAESLEFDHPITHEHLKFTSELPDEFKNFLNKLQDKN